MSGWWSYLEDQTRLKVDAHVLRDRRLVAVKAVWDTLRPLGLGVIDAERVVHPRYEVLGDRVRHTQPDPLDVTSLAARAAAHPGRVGAIEALRDGDTVHNWFVLLVAVLEDPSGKGHLATVHHRTDGPRPGPPPTGQDGNWPTSSAYRSTSPPRTSLTTRRRDGERSGVCLKARHRERKRISGRPAGGSDRGRAPGVFGGRQRQRQGGHPLLATLNV
ncbi:hypothetical protein [Streptomyces sp. HUAS TT20]|uniref:hypothetical protein n=1 Tax=Streptomyces sp. HUAS TT20 TaxID=3447509 RepID=UPI0021D872EF|nr:hypothetical protein [Streptomyces sp. HUAS 15-9]UXY25472.1 hypothetical protein N8I87_02080 [Streptomyces sp. HUAS 15-9]